jgi:hypothetical protein
MVMAAEAGMVDKKTIIGAKVSPDKKSRILRRCEGLNCNTTDYIMTLIDKDLASAEAGPVAAVPAVEPSATPKGRLAVKDENEREIVPGKVRNITYVLDGDKPGGPIKAVEVDGQRFKYCEKCNKYYRKDESGKDVFWNP